MVADLIKPETWYKLKENITSQKFKRTLYKDEFIMGKVILAGFSEFDSDQIPEFFEESRTPKLCCGSQDKVIDERLLVL